MAGHARAFTNARTHGVVFTAVPSYGSTLLLATRQIRATHMADAQVRAPVPSSACPSHVERVSINVLPSDMLDTSTPTCEINARSHSPCNIEQVSMSTRTFTRELDASSNCPSNVKCLRVDLCTDGDAHEWIASYSRKTNTTWIVDRETRNPKR